MIYRRKGLVRASQLPVGASPEAIMRWIDRRGIESAKRMGLGPDWLDYRDYGRRWQFTGPIPQAMALQSMGGHAYIPEWPDGATGAPSFTTTTVDADAEGVGNVFDLPFTGDVTGIGVATGTLTTGDANTLFQLESLTGSSPRLPNGIIAANRSGVANVNASNSWFTATLTTPYTGTQGEQLASTVTRPASGSLNTQFRSFGDSGPGAGAFPYGVEKTSASWASRTGASPTQMTITYGGAYYPVGHIYPFHDITTTTFSSASTPNYVGNLWVPRFKCRVIGAWLWVDLDGGGDINFIATDGVTATSQVNRTTGSRNANGAAIQIGLFGAGAASVTPVVGSTYRIAVVPGATNLSIYDFTVGAAAIMDAHGFGQNMYLSTATSPAGTGDWTNTTTRRVFMGLIIDQFDDGVAGLITHPGYSGGVH